MTTSRAGAGTISATFSTACSEAIAAIATGTKAASAGSISTKTVRFCSAKPCERAEVARPSPRWYLWLCSHAYAYACASVVNASCGAAPAVLGFDDSIDAYCKRLHGWNGRRMASNDTSDSAEIHRRRRLDSAWLCKQANRNILMLFGGNVHHTGAGYNSCRNLE